MENQVFYEDDSVYDQDEIFVPVYQSLMLNPKYSGNEILAWIGLKSYAVGNKNKLFPKKSNLAKHCKLSETTLWRTLKKLEEKGVIVVVPEYNENWMQIRNTYYLAKFNPLSGDWIPQSLNKQRMEKEKKLQLLALHMEMKKEKEFK